MNNPDSLGRPGRSGLGTLAGLAGLLALLAVGVWWVLPSPEERRGEARVGLTAARALAGDDTAGFARATEPRPFVFPEDHGPHPEYRTEWWYITGNVSSREGRDFGFQITFFRNALAPLPRERESREAGADPPADPEAEDPPGSGDPWATNQLWMAHLALTDLDTGEHRAFERFARGAAGLAGAELDPFRVWLHHWQLTGADGSGADGTRAHDPRADDDAAPSEEAVGPEADEAWASVFPLRLRAREGDVAVDLTLEGGKPPVRQGVDGWSQKGPEPGNASYYLSWTRMPVRGEVEMGGERHRVEGLGWMDREWSTSALGPEHTGWDWFSLQLDDGRELMFFELRREGGARDPRNHGSLVARDGSWRTLASDDVALEVLDRWESPVDGAEYPSGWRMTVPGEELELVIRPRVRDSEMDLSFRYWEGAVAVEGRSGAGAVTGRGYVELTGYAEGDANRGR